MSWICSLRSSSSTRTRSGGLSAMIRRPSTILVSLSRACRLLRSRALFTDFLTFFIPPGGYYQAKVLSTHARVPDLEFPHLRIFSHSPPVRSRDFARRSAAIGVAESILPTRHDHACGEALQVPFPRSRQGLVEVVYVEQQCPLRRAIQPEVQEVSIAA